MKRQTCTDYCSGCGRHFHGLGAFDAHRVGQFGVDRHCGDPTGLSGLQVWTEAGYCDFTDSHPTTIWQDSRSAARGAAWRRGRDGEARNGGEPTQKTRTPLVSGQDGALSKEAG